MVELAVARRADQRMIEPRAHERRRLARIGDGALPREATELLGAALAHRLGEVAIEERCEELKRRGLTVLFAHEEQRDRRRRQQQPGRQLHRLERRDRADAVALSAVADLVVVLRADDEALAGQVGARRAAIAAEVLRVLALERESLGQRRRQPPRLGEVGVIAAALAREAHVQRVVEVIRPHRVQPDTAGLGRQHDATVVIVRFGHDVRGPALQARLLARRRGDLGEDMHGARVVDRVDRVQAQTVEVEIAHPGARVLDEVAPHAVAVRTVVVERAAPRCAVAVGEVRPEVAEIVPLGTEVVVDDVEDDRQPMGVTGVHQAAQPAGPAIGRLRREQMDTVVTPVARAGKLGHRHELDRRHAQLHQLGQMRHDGLERAGARERAHVQLVDHEIGRRVTAETLIRPGERRRVHDHGGTVDALRLEAGHRIGPVVLAVETILVARAGGQALDQCLEHAVLLAGERDRAAALDDDIERAAAWRPHPKHHAVVADGGAQKKACAQRFHTVQLCVTDARPGSG